MRKNVACHPHIIRWGSFPGSLKAPDSSKFSERSCPFVKTAFDFAVIGRQRIEGLFIYLFVG